MAWTPFSPEDEIRVQEAVAQKVKNYIASTTTIDPIAYMQEFYNERISRGDSQLKALKLTSLIPQIFRILMNTVGYSEKFTMPGFKTNIEELINKIKVDPSYLFEILIISEIEVTKTSSGINTNESKLNNSTNLKPMSDGKAFVYWILIILGVIIVLIIMVWYWLSGYGAGGGPIYKHDNF